MHTLQTEVFCPICGKDAPALAHGVIAPFISTLSSLPLGYQTELRRCQTCDLTFFDARYGVQELSSLYGNYRGDQYRTTRQRWEPWYSRNVNDACSIDADLVSERRLFMMEVLNAAQMSSELGCVVDFGGDEGQFFPDLPTRRRIVCDVSNRDLPAGIEHVSTLGELDNDKPELVIVAHVLEHLPDPLQPLREIRRAIADDGILYVEVPLDLFRMSGFHATIRYQRYLQRLIRHRFPFVTLDFLSGLSRQFRSSIPRLGVIKQSEHINYFSARSLRAALTASGFAVVAERSDRQAKVGGLRIGCYGVAARPSNEATYPQIPPDTTDRRTIA
jgi:SAM-dependent methyltransferase